MCLKLSMDEIEINLRPKSLNPFAAARPCFKRVFYWGKIMGEKCKECGSYAINHHCHGRDGSDGDLCDVCYWRKRAGELELFKLPCDVLVKPGMIFGKGVPVSTLLLGLRNREAYENDLACMSPEERSERDARIAEFKRLLGISNMPESESKAKGF